MRALDRAIVEVARRQHGVISSEQLAALGATRNAIAHRVARGWLTRLHRGVFRVGPTEAPLARLMAAVLACGETAVVSHRSAAVLHGIRKAAGGPVDITVTTRHTRVRAGVRVHRAKALGRDEVTKIRGIPATTVKRTIQDLAAHLPPNELERAIEEAQVQRHLSLTEAVVGRRGKRGAAALRAAATEEVRFTRSEAERKLLELIKRARLPLPEMNVNIGGWEVDALWRNEGVVVEVDGYAFHSSRRSFERDRRKDGELQQMGLAVTRVTWREMEGAAEAVIARISAALASARRRGAGALRGSQPRRSRP